MICEEFVHFVLCDSGITGERWLAKILGSLLSCGIDSMYLRGHGYDGAGNMAWRCNGAAAIIQMS